MTRHYSMGNNWDVSWTLIYWLSILHFFSLGGMRMCGLWHITANLANHNVTYNRKNLWGACEDACFYQVQTGVGVLIMWVGPAEDNLTLWSSQEHNMSWKLGPHSVITPVSALCQWRLFPAFPTCHIVVIIILAVKQYVCMSVCI